MQKVEEGMEERKKESDRQLLDVPLTLDVGTNILSPSHMLHRLSCKKNSISRGLNKENLSVHTGSHINNFFTCSYEYLVRCPSVINMLSSDKNIRS